jgi:hypothetical protein
MLKKPASQHAWRRNIDRHVVHAELAKNRAAARQPAIVKLTSTAPGAVQSNKVNQSRKFD